MNWRWTGIPPSHVELPKTLLVLSWRRVRCIPVAHTQAKMARLWCIRCFTEKVLRGIPIVQWSRADIWSCLQYMRFHRRSTRGIPIVQRSRADIWSCSRLLCCLEGSRFESHISICYLRYVLHFLSRMQLLLWNCYYLWCIIQYCTCITERRILNSSCCVVQVQLKLSKAGHSNVRVVHPSQIRFVFLYAGKPKMTKPYLATLNWGVYTFSPHFRLPARDSPISISIAKRTQSDLSSSY